MIAVADVNLDAGHCREPGVDLTRWERGDAIGRVSMAAIYAACGGCPVIMACREYVDDLWTRDGVWLYGVIAGGHYFGIRDGAPPPWHGGAYWPLPMSQGQYMAERARLQKTRRLHGPDSPEVRALSAPIRPRKVPGARAARLTEAQKRELLERKRAAEQAREDERQQAEVKRLLAEWMEREQERARQRFIDALPNVVSLTTWVPPRYRREQETG